MSLLGCLYSLNHMCAVSAANSYSSIANAATQVGSKEV